MPALLFLIPVLLVLAALVWWKLRPATRQRPMEAERLPHDAPEAAAPPPQPPTILPAKRPAVNVPGLENAFPHTSPASNAGAVLLPPNTPPELAALHWMRERDLSGARHKALMTVVGGIPRPPLSMQKLLEPDFFNRADPAELSELLMGEPLIAARVLAMVNSPFYGLPQPVMSIEPAVTLLGMDTVRNICLQYMLAQAFRPELASAQRSFDAIWRASAVASELCLHLGKGLNLPEPGALATKVVLVFVGHLAAASLLPSNGVEEWLMLDRLRRAQLEQEVIGLAAGEVASLVLHQWELPAALVQDVSAISRVLVTPASAADAQHAPLLALGYLCVGLGERLALGQLASLKAYDLDADLGSDSFHLRSYFSLPALAPLRAVLNSPELHSAMQHIQGAGVLHH
ncbi:MAG: HDOD domain-containing protein [Giesbergeria sp.]|nr:HDOD domain-containing protein [Giesbergeria sp.]